MWDFHTLYKLISYACFCESLKELLVYFIVSVFMTFRKKLKVRVPRVFHRWSSYINVVTVKLIH